MSYKSLTYHIVFSTKQRRPLLVPEKADRLFAYMGGIARNLQSQILLANGPEDHAHLVAAIHPQVAVADFIGKVKSNSSSWFSETFPETPDFAWQEGYAAFTVSRSAAEEVLAYVRNQREHHRRMTFEQELIALLDKHGIEYDARYVFA